MQPTLEQELRNKLPIERWNRKQRRAFAKLTKTAMVRGTTLPFTSETTIKIYQDNKLKEVKSIQSE